jgi:hypothetical protein
MFNGVVNVKLTGRCCTNKMMQTLCIILPLPYGTHASAPSYVHATAAAKRIHVTNSTVYTSSTQGPHQ